MKSPVDTIRYRSKQDAILIFFVVVSSTQVGGAIYFVFYSLAAFAINLWSKTWRKAYMPIEANNIELPRRTYFIPLEFDKIGSSYIFMSHHKHKYFTWSFFIINFIFCPINNSKDRLGLREMQVCHECEHCRSGEFLLFILSIFSVAQLILAPNILAIARYEEANYFYYHITLNVLGFYMIWAGNEIMVRREHIADYLAHERAGDKYLNYMKSRVEAIPVTIQTGRTGWLGKYLATRFSWHPSWKHRVEFIEGDGCASGTGYWRVCGAAFAMSAGVYFVAQFMISPDNPIFRWAFGPYWNDEVSLVGAGLMVFAPFCIGWLICDAARLFRFPQWLGITFFYCAGALTAQFSWEVSEAIFVRTDNPTTFEIVQFPASYICWFAFHVLLYLNFPMTRSRWSYAAYSGFMFVLILSGMGSIERDFFDLGGVEPPYLAAFTISLVFGLIMTGYYTAIICVLDLIRLALLAIKNRIWSRRHPWSQ